jgi:hypothetical protein
MRYTSNLKPKKWTTTMRSEEELWLRIDEAQDQAQLRGIPLAPPDLADGKARRYSTQTDGGGLVELTAAGEGKWHVAYAGPGRGNWGATLRPVAAGDVGWWLAVRGIVPAAPWRAAG